MKFIVFWKHSRIVEGGAYPVDIIKQDMQRGVVAEFGAFSPGRGFFILDVKNETQAFAEMTKYWKYNVQVLSSEPFLSLDEVEKIFSQA